MLTQRLGHVCVKYGWASMVMLVGEEHTRCVNCAVKMGPTFTLDSLSPSVLEDEETDHLGDL